MIIIPPITLTIPDDIVSTNVPADTVPPAAPEDEMRYQMFLPVSSQLTTSLTNILVQIKPRQRWDTLMLFNVGADQMSASLLNGPTWSTTVTLRYADPPTPTLLNKPDVYLEVPTVDPLVYPNATLVVNLWVTTARPTTCELLAVGTRRQIGMTTYGTEFSIIDYSLKRRDEFGEITLVERGYNDQVRYRFELPTSSVGETRALLADLRATPTGYLGHPDIEATYLFGLFQEFSIPVEGPVTTTAELTVGSVVRTGSTDTEVTTFQAAYIPLNPGCIEEHLGFLAKLTLNDDGELGDQQVRVGVELGRELLAGETYEWIVEWDPDVEMPGGSASVLATSCDQQYITYTWPTSAPDPLSPCIATLSLVLHQLDGTSLTSNAVVLVIQHPPTEPCTEDTLSAGWYDATTERYTKAAVSGAVGHLDARALALVFDEDYYLDENPDVAASIGISYENAYAHYYIQGDAENRRPNRWFAPAYYKMQNPDVVAVLYPNIPTYFYNTLQHYQMFGYSEQRDPCDPSEWEVSATYPRGTFFWTARVATDTCGGGVCTTQWEQSFTGSAPPKVTIEDNVVVVTSVLASGTSSPDPVSTGVLRLTPTVQCPAAVEGGPVPDPVTLDPLTLTIHHFTCGWGSGFLVVTETALVGPGTWTAGVTGDLTDCTVTWGVQWSGSSSSRPTIGINGGILTVSNVISGGIVTVCPQVSGPHGTITTNAAYLVLGDGGYTLGWYSDAAHAYTLTAENGALRALTQPYEASTAPVIHFFGYDGQTLSWVDFGQGVDGEVSVRYGPRYDAFACAAKSVEGTWLPRSEISAIWWESTGDFGWQSISAVTQELGSAVGEIEGFLMAVPSNPDAEQEGAVKVGCSAEVGQTEYGLVSPAEWVAGVSISNGIIPPGAVVTWSYLFTPADGYEVTLPSITPAGLTCTVRGRMNGTSAAVQSPGILSVSATVTNAPSTINIGPILLTFAPE